MKVTKNKAYAFWKYDLFPYILGDEVESIRRCKINGRLVVSPKGYNGCEFYVSFFTTIEEGEELKMRLYNLSQDRASVLKEFDNTADNLVESTKKVNI